MALTAQTTLDIVGQTQTISFYESGSLVDQITYSGNAITLSGIAAFNLSKSDFALYISYLTVYVNALYINFPSIRSSTNGQWPNVEFDITIISSPVAKIIYTQTFNGAVVNTITYVPLASAASFILRSPITVTLQEFFMSMNMLVQYANQVSLN